MQRSTLPQKSGNFAGDRAQWRPEAAKTSEEMVKEQQLPYVAPTKGRETLQELLPIIKAGANGPQTPPPAARDPFENAGPTPCAPDPPGGANPEGLPRGPFAVTAKLPEGLRRGEYAGFVATPGFRKWFAESKVVFKEAESDYFQNPEGICGFPRIVYYGTNADANFDIFRPDERGAIWFRSDPTAAERVAGRQSATIPAFLKIENPFELTPGDSIAMGTAMEKAKALGRDGVILDQGGGDYLYTVFSPEQVRSALTGDPLDTGDIELCCDPGCANSAKELEGQRHRASSSPLPAADAILGKMFQDIEKTPVQIIGLRAKNYADLAVLAQAWRNPHYEEFRYVFVRRGIIVDHERGTCMHPGFSRAYLGDDFDAYMEHLKDRIRALEATAVYMVHNHPNGNPEPSDADIWASAAVAMCIPQFRGHIIINSCKYGYIDATATDSVVKCLPKPPKDWVDPILHPSIPHELLGREAENIENVATWAKALTIHRDVPVLIYIDSDGKVRGLQEIHPRSFTNIPLIRGRMAQKLIDFGSVSATAVLPENASEMMLDAVRYYVRAHILRDAIGFCGASPYFFGEVDSEVEYFGGSLRASLAGRSVW
ncbi:MAG: JAB domain-containing protein [Syntrophobacteraceae bacterium]|nr:JAB domain-containing protein [Syntrophobacteraceae bacterium]